MTTATTDRRRPSVRVYRASMRGWNYVGPHAHIVINNCYVTAKLTATASGWCAEAQWNGVTYSAHRRRQMDAAIAVGDLMWKQPTT